MTVKSKVDFTISHPKGSFNCSLVRDHYSRMISIYLEDHADPDGDACFVRVGRIWFNKERKLQFDLHYLKKPHVMVLNRIDPNRPEYYFELSDGQSAVAFIVPVPAEETATKLGEFTLPSSWTKQFTIELIVALTKTFLDRLPLSQEFLHRFCKLAEPEMKKEAPTTQPSGIPALFEYDGAADHLFGRDKKEALYLVKDYLWRGKLSLRYSLIIDHLNPELSLGITNGINSKIIGKFTLTSSGITLLSPHYQPEMSAYVEDIPPAWHRVVVVPVKRMSMAVELALSPAIPRLVSEYFNKVLTARGFTIAGVRALITLIEEYLDARDDLEKILTVNTTVKQPWEASVSRFQSYPGQRMPAKPIPTPIKEEPIVEKTPEHRSSDIIDLENMSISELRYLTHEIENGLRSKRIDAVRKAIVGVKDTKIRTEYDRLLKELIVGRKVFIDDILDRLELILHIEETGC